MEAKRYADTVQQLSELNEKRQQLRERVERLSRLQSVIQPLRTSEGGGGVQENIITRNGAIEKELERMRFLLARVGGRVGALPEPQDPGNPAMDVDLSQNGGLGVSRKRRVDQFLADQSVFPS